MSKVLIVGGNGYIGSQTNLFFQKQNQETLVLDKKPPYFLKYLNNPAKHQYVFGDLLDISSLEAVFANNKISSVIHFAAYIEVKESQLEPEKYYYNNVVGTLNLLQTMKKFGVKNIIFSSTAATYGEPKNIPITEKNTTLPINTYGRTKLMVEQILQDYVRSYNFNSICFRYFNACGADLQGQTGENHQPESHLIPIILQVVAKQREYISIFGNDYPTKDGTCIRDYVHTVDLAKAHFLGYRKLQELSNNNDDSKQNGGFCKSINLSTDNGYSVLEIISAVEKVTQIKVNTKIEARREGDPAILTASNSLAKDILNWEPEYSSLENIISTSWNWYKKLNNL